MMSKNESLSYDEEAIRRKIGAEKYTTDNNRQKVVLRLFR